MARKAARRSSRCEDMYSASPSAPSRSVNAKRSAGVIASKRARCSRLSCSVNLLRIGSSMEAVMASRKKIESRVPASSLDAAPGGATLRHSIMLNRHRRTLCFRHGWTRIEFACRPKAQGTAARLSAVAGYQRHQARRHSWPRESPTWKKSSSDPPGRRLSAHLRLKHLSP